MRSRPVVGCRVAHQRRSLAHSLGYSWLTVRRCVHAAKRVRVMRGGRHFDEVWGWERARS